MLRHKLIRAETKVEDAERGLVRAVVSTEAKDRNADLIREAHWDLGERTAMWDELWRRMLTAIRTTGSPETLQEGKRRSCDK